MASDKELRLALVVENFLPIGQVWIWRQLFLDTVVPSIVFARNRSNEFLYPWNGVILYNKRGVFFSKVRVRLWFFFKHFYFSLNPKEKTLIRSGIKRFNIVVLHAHFGTVGCELLDLCRELNVRLIVTFHGFDATAVPKRWPGYSRKLHQLFKNSFKIIAVSAFIKQKLIELGCPPKKIDVLYLGVPIPKDKKVYWKDDSKIRFIHVGSFVEKKGVPDLIRAFSKAFPTSSNVELLLVGDGPERELCRRLISELNPANPILMKDTVPSNLVYQEFLQADVFVLNSRIDSQGTTEGLPIALLEAQSYGLPVISTLHAGIPEAVSQEGACLVPERDEESLVSALRLMVDGDRIRLMGEASRMFVEGKFNLKECNRKLERLYHSAVYE